MRKFYHQGFFDFMTMTTTIVILTTQMTATTNRVTTQQVKQFSDIMILLPILDTLRTSYDKIHSNMIVRDQQETAIATLVMLWR